jgi:hypothetical protein
MGEYIQRKIKWDGGVNMNNFNHLVSEQMRTMEKLLYLQSELERCEEIEGELNSLVQETELESIQLEIANLRLELREIQQLFESQTEEVIRSYQNIEVTV